MIYMSLEGDATSQISQDVPHLSVLHWVKLASRTVQNSLDLWEISEDLDVYISN